MDINQTLISTTISIGTYILYKIFQKYYVRSGCHNSTIEIVIVNKEAEQEEKEKEKVAEQRTAESHTTV